jgi:hypothetical protein
MHRIPARIPARTFRWNLPLDSLKSSTDKGERLLVRRVVCGRLRYATKLPSSNKARSRSAFEAERRKDADRRRPHRCDMIAHRAYSKQGPHASDATGDRVRRKAAMKSDILADYRHRGTGRVLDARLEESSFGCLLGRSTLHPIAGPGRPSAGGPLPLFRKSYADFLQMYLITSE